MNSNIPNPAELPLPPAYWLKPETQLLILEKLISTLQINKKNLDIINNTLVNCYYNNLHHRKDQFLKDYMNKDTLFYSLTKKKKLIHKISIDSLLKSCKFYNELL